MKIFIDESGVFSKSENRSYSISCIGALVIASCYYPELTKKYLEIRPSLPKDNKGEVKGKMLNEQQVSGIIDLLWRNDAFFEAVLIDMNMQDDMFLQEQKNILRENHSNRLSKTAKNRYKRMLKMLNSRIDAMSPQLFVQFTLTTKLLSRVLQHAPTYFSLRQPKELGSFEWYVDAKGKNGITKAEEWWSQTVSPFLSTLSRKEEEGGMHIKYGDYSYYDKAYGAEINDHPPIDVANTPNGTDLSKVFSNINFMSDYNSGLELVDIVTNALRRALMGNLQENGWHNLPEIIIRRQTRPSIPFILFSEGEDVIMHAPYKSIYNKLNPGRKSMLTNKASKLAANEIDAY